ncbi:RagB/SusD family nutrient uptake outer membrane protein [Rhodothermus bifroesti]|uniref:RagB/SusD family nutrient uptake outer membrane protein n=1 Tax=Rhodothermus marinus TaxID=29549 RepID=A0A7V2F6I3_RHOMR|nr:RagB/SusD family nutrient uptake outer membrane protein [Rhodothermus bifroesti]
MKAAQTLLLLLLCGGLMVGCDGNFLELTNPNLPTTDTFWKTADDAIKAVNACYEPLTFDGMYGRFMHILQDLRADDAVGDSPWGEIQNVGRFNLNAASFGPFLAWRDAYNGIYRTNQVLKYVPNIEMDPELKARLLGEAKFLRAFYYFHLVKMFNNVPLILEPAEKEEQYRQPQAPPEQVWAQIIQDLKEAQTVLPQRYTNEADIGRATWGAATAYLGVAYLFTGRYAEADAEFKKIIDSGLYQLVDDPRLNGGYEGENNAESIFEIQFSREVGGTVPGWGGTPNPSWGETQARSITYSPPGFGWADTNPTRCLYQTFKQERTVDGQDDPRLHATMFYYRPGMTVYGVPWEQLYGNDTTSVYWRKYQSDIPGGNEFDMRSGINIRVMRYADVLLMYAETRNELGDQATAARYIQMVRNRARLPNREAEFAAMSQAQLREVIARERFLELAGEGKRFDDLRRWGWLSNPAKLAELRACDPEFNGYAPGREWLPIPQAEMDANPLLQQNPSY